MATTVPMEVMAAMQGQPLPAAVAQAAELAARNEMRDAEALLRRHLAPDGSCAGGDAALSAFSLLLHLLERQDRRGEIFDALRAPWSPVRADCEEEFDRMYGAAIAATASSPLPLRRRRRHRRLAALFESTRGLAGQVAECGCFLGLSSHLLCQLLAAESPAFDGRGYHIFDSFQGLSDPAPEDAIPADHKDAKRLNWMNRAGAFAAPLEQVQRNLARFPGIAYHRGWIPLSFDGLPEQRYRFVHLDVDLYDPTLDSLEYFFPRLTKGGIVVSDDYSWPGARRSIEEFCTRHGVRYSPTDADQAFIVAA